MTSERISMQHNCVFHGLKLIKTAAYRDFGEDHAIFGEDHAIFGDSRNTRDKPDAPRSLRDGRPERFALDTATDRIQVTGDDDLLTLGSFRGIEIVRPSDYWSLRSACRAMDEKP